MKRTYRLNLRLVLCLLAAVVLLGVGLRYLHAYQVQRNAAALLRLANEAEKQKDLAKAARYLNLYLAHVPSDTDALAKHGEILAKLASHPNTRLHALLVLDQVLRREPTRHKSRKLLVQLAMHPDLGRYSDAEVHLNELMKEAFPNNCELHHLRALCREAGGKYDLAKLDYDAAIKCDPRRLDSYVHLADLQRRRLNKPAAADETMQKLVEANGTSFQAWLARGRYRRALSAQEREPKLAKEMLKHAAADIGKARQLADLAAWRGSFLLLFCPAAAVIDNALQLAEDDSEVLLEAAELDRLKGKLAEARATLKHGLDKHDPKLHHREVRLQLYKALARLAVQARQLDDAVKWVEQGLKDLPEETELLYTLANLELQRGEHKKAEEITARLRQRRVQPALLDFLEGRILVQKGNWRDAIGRLEKVHAQLTPWPDAQLQANLLLGHCYEQLGDSAAQQAAYRRAAMLDPQSEAACLGLGSALVALGKLEQALEAYRPILARSSQARLLTAQLLSQRAQWDEAWLFLEQMARLGHDEAEVAILRAEVHVGKNDPDSARKELTASRDKQPDNVALWVALSALAQRQNRWNEALALLDEAEKKLNRPKSWRHWKSRGDQVALRLARARLWAERGGKEGREAVAKLTGELDQFTGKEWRRLVLGLADAHLRLGNNAEAGQLYRNLAKSEPNNLAVRLVLFDLVLLADPKAALQAGQNAELQAFTKEVRRIEGEDGTLWRFGEACRLIRLARDGDKTTREAPLKEASKLLTKVAEKRAGWSRLELAQAEICELSGKPEAALRHYQQVIASGDRAPDVIRRAVQLLYQRGDPGSLHEADEMLQKLQDQTTQLGGLERVAADLALFKQDKARALQLAQKAVAPDSKDYRDLLWLGRMHAAAGRWEEAGPLFRRAVDLAEKAPEVWLTLVHYLAQMQRKDQVQQAIAEASKKLPAEHAALTLAQCHELLEQHEQAQQLYKAALRARPADPTVLRNVTRFALQRRQLSWARECLETIRNLPGLSAEDAAWAKRTLAIVLVAGGDYHQARAALGLLGIKDLAQLKDLASGVPAEEQRVWAVVLASQQNARQRHQAIDILQPLTRKQQRDEDRFMLAQLYESVGEWRSAQLEMLSLLSRHGDNPTYLAQYTNILLARKDIDEAERYLVRLEKVQPNVFRTLRLRALVLKANNKAEQAVPALKALAESKPSQLAPVAMLLEEIGQHDAAEELYRRFAAESKRPEAVLVLAAYLGRRNRPDEALQLCERAAKTCPAEAVAEVSLEILTTAKVGPEHYQAVSRQIEAAVRQSTDKTSLVMALAVLRRLEGRIRDAITLYRQVVARDPRDALARNNLAWLLALHEENPKEALVHIEEAVKAAGPLATLLDTRAVVQLKLGNSRAAAQDLAEAIADSPTPSRYFHLAQALMQNRDGGEAARAALQRARELGLREEAIDSLELAAYQKLCSDLKPKK